MLTRMGDASMVDMSYDEIVADVNAANEETSRKAKCPMLPKGDLDALLDIICNPAEFVSVKKGNELCLTYDGPCSKFIRMGVELNRGQAIQIYENALMADTSELSSVQYSFKLQNTYYPEEQGAAKQILLTTTIPVVYGAMPNMSLYAKQDGPFENPAELLPQGKVKEAQEAQEQAAAMMRDNLVFCAKHMSEIGLDGIDFDTAASAGDAEFLGCLEAMEEIKRLYPDLSVVIGMSGEFILGMHGRLKYKGKRLAGMWCYDQALVCAEAGADIFGPVVNVNCSKSFAWNLAKAVSLYKYTAEVSPIPVFGNVGMGVGGVPMSDIPPRDAVSRVSTALAEIARLDGL